MGRERMERSQLNGGAASVWGGLLSPEAKTQSSLSSMKQNWSQNPSPSDPELLRPLAQKREGARGPRRERVEGRILDGLSMDEFSSPCSSFKSIN